MKNNPWKGLVPYEEKDLENYEFCGRTKAISKYYSLIINNLVSTLYGRTGCGKTSMLQAGIFPLLRQESYFPVTCRLSLKNESASFADYLIERVEQEINSFGFSCKESVIPVNQVGDLEKYRLWKYFYGHNFKEKDDNVIFPVIVLDQFEEVLINSKDDSLKFLEQISFLVGDDLLLPDNCYANFRVIISLREDYLYLLEDTIEKGNLQRLRDNRMRLTSLSIDEAEEVIVLGSDFFTEEERKQIYREICCLAENRRKHISTNMLSLICSQIYQIYSRFDGKKLVSLEDVKKLSKDPLREFYKSCIDGVKKETVTFIENNLVLNESRRPVTMQEFETKVPKSDRKKLTSGETKILQFITANDNVCVELIHDTLARTISSVAKETANKISIQKRRNNNYKRFLSRQNPLALGGRQIWDNKTFSFSIDNSVGISLNNSSNRDEVMKDLLQQRYNDDNGVEHLFFDKLLRQTQNTGKISLVFNGSCSKDGISIFEIETAKVGTSKQLKIKQIIFKDSYNKLFYTKDGFYGIIYDYDKETGNEIKRKYLCNEYTSVCIVGIKFEKFNEYGFPTKVSYFDNADNPCKHLDGNYGVQIEYDDCGNETCRWFLDQSGEKAPIYNGVHGIANQHDDLDRVTKQYFIDSSGKRVFDIYGFHGIGINYNKAPNELLASETCYLDVYDDFCNNPQNFCVEQLQYDDTGRVIWQIYLDKDRIEVEKNDGVYSYSRLKIGYNESDKPDNLTMYNLSGNILKRIRYSYNPNGSLCDSTFYEVIKSRNGQIERKSRSNDILVHKVEYLHDNHGVLICQKNFDEEGNPMKDSNSFSKICYSFNDSGILIEQSCYNFEESETEPIYRICFSTVAENISEVKFIEYEIKTVYSTSRKILRAYKNKKERHIAELKKIDIFKGLLNHRYQLVKVYYDEDNDYMSGTPLTVRLKYDIDGNVVERLFYDINDESPICDESGAYGWRQNDNKIEYLGENAEIANNKYGYAIIKYSSEVHDGVSYSVTAYYDKDCIPTMCEDGYHKKKEITDASSYDDLCKQIRYFNSNDEPCDCLDGYSRQLFEEEKINENEVKILVSFWGVDDTPRLNKGLGFHKREVIISVSTGKEPMEICRSFKDENDILINIHEGFAKKTCKRYDSFSTFFYYPFTDYKVIRFYDEKDKKVDVDFPINGVNYHAYKFMVSLDGSSCFKVTNSSGKIKYRKKSLLWRCFNIIWIPPVTVLFFIVALICELFKWFYGLFKSNHKYTPESCTIIRVAEIKENVSNREGVVKAPIRQYDVEEGCWIVKWNNWLYNPNQDVATAFVTEFNNSLEHKSITFYNPNEKEFLDVEIISSNIGIQIQDAQAPIKDVEEMITMWNYELSHSDKQI